MNKIERIDFDGEYKVVTSAGYGFYPDYDQAMKAAMREASSGLPVTVAIKAGPFWATVLKLEAPNVCN